MKIEIKDLYKEIKKNVILDNVNITLTGGKIYGIQGKNGCGKTMLMRSIAGLVIPTRGSIIINGKVLHRDISIPESIGGLIENPSFLPRYSGYENLKMLAMLDDKVSDGEIKDLLEKVGLKDAADKKFGKYSLGMRQRLGIAQAIMEDPQILLLDEPLNGLDNEGVEEMRNVLLKQKEQGKLIIIASHSKEDIDILCDEIFRFDHGKIIGHEVRG